MTKLFNNLIKTFNKYKVEILLTIAIVATICVIIYQQKEELFGGETYTDENDNDEKDDEDNDEKEKKYIFIKEGTCNASKRANITNGEVCQAAAKELGWTTFKYNNMTGTYGEDRPAGCSRHPFGNLDYFPPGKSKGAANVNGYSGVYCKKRPSPKFKIWKYENNEDLFAKNWPNIKDRDTEFKKARLSKWKTKVTRIGGKILKKVTKFKKLLANAESDSRRENLQKRIASRETRAAQLKKAYDQIDAVYKTL